MHNTLLVGFGAMAQALVPALIRHSGLQGSKLQALAADDEGASVAQRYGVDLTVQALTEENYRSVLGQRLSPGDWLINLSVNVSSLALIDWCQAHDVLYLDTCIEPWAGGYEASPTTSVEQTTNYSLRHQALLRAKAGRPTAVVAHGANPGLVSHFVKHGLLQFAEQRGVCASSWAALSQRLGIKVIQIAERDTQVAATQFAGAAFANTWSVDGFMSEAMQRAELGFGSHEPHLPEGAHTHAYGDGAAIYLDRRSCEVRVKSWVPLVGEQEARLITHHEAISIASFLTHRTANGLYRPTVYYAYAPCPAAENSLRHWPADGAKRARPTLVLKDQLTDGLDQLGVLLCSEVGSYWYGSTVSLSDARALLPENNATSLQVVAGIIGALNWMQANPRAGVVEAEALPHDEILSAAMPYLGKLEGIQTDWRPAHPGQLAFSNFLLT